MSARAQVRSGKKFREGPGGTGKKCRVPEAITSGVLEGSEESSRVRREFQRGLRSKGGPRRIIYNISGTQLIDSGDSFQGPR